jgi:hypothetical protein
MTFPTHDWSRAEERPKPSVSTGASRVDVHRLTRILESLLFGRAVPQLPDWSYRTWYRVLQYPDLNPRAHEVTRDLGRRRDDVLGHPAVRDLVHFAGTRRRDDLSAGAAAALVAITPKLARPHESVFDVVDLVRVVLAEIDAAQPVISSWRRVGRTQLVAEPDLLAAIEPDPPETENPLLPLVVRVLLTLATDDVDPLLCARAEAAVVQAGDWWARHSMPVPTSLDGPALPGVVPAQRLRDSERISAHVSDAAMLHLVAGPHPGRSRPCQVAWRRGLTFWAAASLWAGGVERPSREAVRWWQSQLASVSRQKCGGQRETADVPMTAAS